MAIAIAGVTAGDQTPAKDRTAWLNGVLGSGGRLRNQTGSSGGSSVSGAAVAIEICNALTRKYRRHSNAEMVTGQDWWRDDSDS